MVLKAGTSNAVFAAESINEECARTFERSRGFTVVIEKLAAVPLRQVSPK